MVLIPAALVTVVVIVVLVLLIAGGGDDDEESAAPATGMVAARDLVAGTCVSDANSTRGDVRTFDAVACDKPHDGEVYTVITLKGAKNAKYPGKRFVDGKGQRGCRARLRRQLTAKAFRDRRLGYKYVYPTKQSWAQGDREVTCRATFSKPRSKKLAQRSAKS